MRIKQAQLVKAPRERVFEAWTDYEAYPKWDGKVFTRVTVTHRAGNTASLDMETRFMGMTMPRKERHVLTPPEKVEVDGSVPIAGNTTVWTFEDVPGGTLLTAVLEVQFRGMLGILSPLARWQARSMLSNWMQAFANYVEAT